MNRKDMISEISREMWIQKKEAGYFYDTFLGIIKEALLNGFVIDFRSLMKLEVSKQQPRKLKHPKTGQPMQTQPFKVLKCKVSQIFRKELNSK